MVLGDSNSTYWMAEANCDTKAFKAVSATGFYALSQAANALWQMPASV